MTNGHPTQFVMPRFRECCRLKQSCGFKVYVIYITVFACVVDKGLNVSKVQMHKLFSLIIFLTKQCNCKIHKRRNKTDIQNGMEFILHLSHNGHVLKILPHQKYSFLVILLFMI